LTFFLCDIFNVLPFTPVNIGSSKGSSDADTILAEASITADIQKMMPHIKASAALSALPINHFNRNLSCTAAQTPAALSLPMFNCSLDLFLTLWLIII